MDFFNDTTGIRPKWEYIHVMLYGESETGKEWKVYDGFGKETIIVTQRFATMLDVLGHEGWEMAGGSHQQYVFKRKIID